MPVCHTNPAISAVQIAKLGSKGIEPSVEVAEKYLRSEKPQVLCLRKALHAQPRLFAAIQWQD